MEGAGVFGAVHQMNPKLRSLITIAPVIVPVVLVVVVCLAIPILAGIRRAAARDAYSHGKITREDARVLLGEEVDRLPEPSPKR
jgi:hypothetical protein